MHLLIALALMVGQVGSMMGPGSVGAGGTPGSGFALTTESSDPLATESSSIIVLESAP